MNKTGMRKLFTGLIAVALAVLAIDGYRAFTNHSVCTGETEIVHTNEREIAFRYQWSWDGKPHSLGTDLVHLEYNACNTEAQYIDDTDAKLSGMIHYQTADGEVIDQTLELDETHTGKFPMKIKAENSAGKTVTAWAQSGAVEVSIAPISEKIDLDYIKLTGVYGHQKTGLWIQEAEPDALFDFGAEWPPAGYTELARVQDRLTSTGELTPQ